MASQQSSVDAVLTRIQDAGVVRARKMFGEFTIYCDEKVVAMVADDQLFVKPTPAGVELVGKEPDAPPYPGAKLHLWIVSPQLEDSAFLTNLITTTAASLPPPKPRKNGKSEKI